MAMSIDATVASARLAQAVNHTQDIAGIVTNPDDTLVRDLQTHLTARWARLAHALEELELVGGFARLLKRAGGCAAGWRRQGAYL